jgi:hypothetical protein
MRRGKKQVTPKHIETLATQRDIGYMVFG